MALVPIPTNPPSGCNNRSPWLKVEKLVWKIVDCVGVGVVIFNVYELLPDINFKYWAFASVIVKYGDESKKLD